MERDDELENYVAIVDGSRVFSAFDIEQHKVWVITEADRSVTTVLLPHEY